MSTFKSHQQVFLEALGAVNNKNLVGKLTVGTAGLNDTEFPGEAKVTLTGIEGQATGTVDIHYHRNNIAEVAEYVNLNPLILRGEDPSKADVIAALRARGVNITAADVGELTPTEYEVSIIMANENSLLYQAMLGVSVLEPLPGQTGVQVVNSATELPFSEEDLVEPMVAPSTIDSAAEVVVVGEVSTMRFSSGNRATHFNSTSNGELSLSLSARQYRKVPVEGVEEPEEGVFSLLLEEGGDWSIFWSIALHGEYAARKLVDMYDIRMIWRQTLSDQELVWEMIDGPDRPYFRMAHDHSKQIVDSLVDQSVSQNSQRMTHYMEGTANNYFGIVSTVPGNDAAPGGHWVFEIEAIRKNSITDRRLTLVTEVYADTRVDEPEPEDEFPGV